MGILIHTDLLRLLAVCYLDLVIACTAISGGVPTALLQALRDLISITIRSLRNGVT